MAIRADCPANPTPASAGPRNRRVGTCSSIGWCAGWRSSFRRRRRRTAPRRTTTDVAGRHARGRPAAARSQGRCRPPPSRRRAAFDPERRPRRPGPCAIPERPDQPPELLRGSTSAARRRQELQRHLASVGQQVDGRLRRVDADVAAARGRTRTAPASAQRRRVGTWCIGRRADVARPRRCRRRATRSSSSPRRRASARAAPSVRSGAGAARPVEMLLTNSSSGTGLPSRR